MEYLAYLYLLSSPQTTKLMESGSVTETEDSTGTLFVSASEFKYPPQTIADIILERYPGRGNAGGGNLTFLYVNECYSLGATYIASSLGE